MSSNNNQTKPPVEPAVRSVWTAADEQRLRELAERRERIMAENRHRLQELLFGHAGIAATDNSLSQIVDALINHADMVRLVLLPFSKEES